MSSRSDYIDALGVGSLIAFKLDKLEAKMYSGKVTKIGKTKVEVATKNGRKFFVDKECIHWVNITGKWPAHIMQALKGIDGDTYNNTPIDVEASVEETEVLEVIPEEQVLPEDIDIKLVDDEIVEVEEDGKEEGTGAEEAK